MWVPFGSASAPGAANASIQPVSGAGTAPRRMGRGRGANPDRENDNLSKKEPAN